MVKQCILMHRSSPYYEKVLLEPGLVGVRLRLRICKGYNTQKGDWSP